MLSCSSPKKTANQDLELTEDNADPVLSSLQGSSAEFKGFVYP